MAFQYACGGRIDAAIEESKKAHKLGLALGAPLSDLFNLHIAQGRHAGPWLKLVSRPGGDAAYADALRRKFQQEGIGAFLQARISRGLELMRSGAGAPLAQLYTYRGSPAKRSAGLRRR